MIPLFILLGSYRGVIQCYKFVDLNGPLHSNWVGLLELLSQPTTSKQHVQLTPQTITPKKTLQEIFKEINTQVLEFPI